MPPKTHSSSSSSSRSSSSSPRSSSRSSSSSFGSSRSSSSFGSRSSFGPSSHSRSSSSSSGGSLFSGFGSSRSGGPSRHSSSSFSSAPRRDNVEQVRRNPSYNYDPIPPMRPRHNQPNLGSALLTAMLFRGMNHDYVYYDKPYEVDGKTYQPGYYDENGTRYDNLMMKNADGSNTLILTCEYCGTTTKLDWKEGDVPHCSKCGAPLDIEKAQKDNISSSGSYNSETEAKTKTKKKSSCLKWALIGVGLILLLTLFRSCGKTGTPQMVSVRPTNTVQMILPTARPTSTPAVSVPAGGTIRLGQNADGSYYLITDDSTAAKILQWDANSDSFYDPETDTYFWYNTDLENPVWQYWVEGVSSDYGDYGWMEYNNGKWYVEVSDGNWREYTGNPSGFWYITDKKSDSTGSTSTSAIPAGSTLRLKRNADGTYIVLEGNRGKADKEIPYDPETESYYDKETDTYIWYNNEASQWQYWVEGLSSLYGDAGWMEYNDGQWYIETQPGSWVKYTDDNGTLWYIER